MSEQNTQFDWTGVRLADRYQIVALAGAGGAGAVYRARDERSGAHVAIKILHAQRADMVERFEREIRTLIALEHDGIVKYVDHGKTAEGDAFLVMEWLDGEDLARRLTRAPLSIDEALRLARRVAGTLAFAHARGFLHRDIKPENIFLPGGELAAAKLLDFGLARAEHDATGPTLQGALLGTPAYMSPEQASGSIGLDARTDLFALGSVLFESLAGRPIFEGGLVHVLSKIVLEDAPRVRTLRADVPLDLDRMLAQLLSRDPALRPDAATVLLECTRIENAPALGSTDQHYEATLTRTLRTSAEIAWALLADTNRWDRIAGAKPTTYHRADSLPPDAPRGSRIGRASLMGMDVGWVEVGEWVEGSFFWGERRFVEGPVPCIGYRIRVAPSAPGACEVEATVYLAGAALPPAEVCEMLRSTFHARLERYLDAIERLLGQLGEAPPDGEDPPGSRARRILLSAPPDPLLVGRRTQTPDSEYEVRARALADAPIDADVREALVRFLDQRSDDEVRQIRAFELARAWSFDRREVLRAFLHATRAGLTELLWQLICPRCRVAAGFASRLADARTHAHCATCDARFDLDFARNVEAVFNIAPSVRNVAPTIYCGGSPVFRPHVFATLRALPGQTREEAARSVPSDLVVRLLGAVERLAVPTSAATPASITVRLGPAGVAVESSSDRSPDGRTLLRVVNETDTASDVMFERALDVADVVTGVALASVPEYSDLFAADAPAARDEVGVGNVCLLAASVHDARGLYRELGDARAFALVSEMLDAAGEIIARDGAVVRTDGESFLACFLAPARAAAAALELALHTSRIAGEHGHEAHALSAAVHVGPALLVGAHGRREFFGSTLHVLRSLLASAGPGEVAVSAAVASHPGAEAILRAWGEGSINPDGDRVVCSRDAGHEPHDHDDADSHHAHSTAPPPAN